MKDTNENIKFGIIMIAPNFGPQIGNHGHNNPITLANCDLGLGPYLYHRYPHYLFIFKISKMSYLEFHTFENVTTL